VSNRPEEKQETKMETAPQAEGSVEEAPQTIVVDSEIIDYNKRYQASVDTKASINWGNIILLILIALVLVGGGSFIIWNEKRIRGKVQPKLVAQESPTHKETTFQVEGISLEAALLPQLNKMSPVGLRALHRLLEHPEEASDCLLVYPNWTQNLFAKSKILIHAPVLYLSL
jgi:hypothetical protein